MVCRKETHRSTASPPLGAQEVPGVQLGSPCAVEGHRARCQLRAEGITATHPGVQSQQRGDSATHPGAVVKQGPSSGSSSLAPSSCPAPAGGAGSELLQALVLLLAALL